MPHTISELRAFILSGQRLELHAEERERIDRCKAYLDAAIAAGGDPVYGINTGFGALCNTIIPRNDLALLQRNLLVSHACGMGREIPREVVRWMLLLKVKALALGHSGVARSTVQRLTDFYNLGILPVVYESGSLGASGDLAPLAHLALPLIGEGEVYVGEERMSSREALSRFGLEPLELGAKEGLALINGTQFMSAYACHILDGTEQLMERGLEVAAMSLEAYMGRREPFEPYTHLVRPHEGQRRVAAEMLRLIDGSELQQVHREHVQDPYSFRCIPQVHGASWDAIRYVRQVVETEINSVTDNPIIFPEEGRIISGGNFHGQPLGLALDLLSVALAELGSISERRTYKLIGGQRGLPPFLMADAGLNSGFMIPQYTAASLVSQNKQLCTPTTVDTIDSSNGQEDHVSMGANGATRCLRVLQNTMAIAGIELLTAAQALDFRRPLRSSATVEALHERLRSEVPFIHSDIYLKPAMDKAMACVAER